MSNIEVETRSFISDDEYARLVSFMESDAEHVKDDEQETVYFSGDKDIRLQKNTTGAKIILKSGKIHDINREETEVVLKREDFGKMKTILAGIGLEVEIRWFRRRKEFLWSGAKVCLDRTKGYGNIIEIEILCGEDKVEKSRKKVSGLMKELKINQTPKYVFDEKFNYYKNNWKRLVED